ncbi:GFA family protein [Sphingopyxis sp.]|uniref:GFA family protein n=1 Tax=Sphingopyxis sp. TaxID=1908224 RepID=UPI001DDA0009|nr:GFA family protein [Sphingopyxis sp.]MBW8296357.1 GFA family protein [Sphingopyxis sp.]
MADTAALSGYPDAPVALPVEGGCACGQLRYSIAAQPVIGLHCHCNHCQRLSGTGHGAFLVLPIAAATIHGQSSAWTYVADSGGTSTRHFCPQCGAPVYARLSLHPDGIVVPAASLDRRADFRPTVALFTGEAQAWDAPGPSLKHFPGGL